MRLMCPGRGFVYWSYDYIKELNDNLWIDEYGHESDVYFTALIWPKDKNKEDSKSYREKVIQIVGSQTDLFDKF